MNSGRLQIVVSVLASVILFAGCDGDSNGGGSSSSGSNSQSLTGHWSGTAVYLGTPAPLVIGLIQNGSSVTSDGSLNQTSHGISTTVSATGTVSGNSFILTYTQTINGQPILTYRMEGTFNNNTMSGDLLVMVTGGSNLPGTFELTRQ